MIAQKYYMLDIQKYEYSNMKNILLTFPNLCTTIKIYLTISIENFSAERGFPKLARIKHKQKTSSSQENLNNYLEK